MIFGNAIDLAGVTNVKLLNTDTQKRDTQHRQIQEQRKGSEKLTLGQSISTRSHRDWF